MLMTHCGAHKMPLEEIASLPVPAAQGPRHQPVPFYEFIEGVKHTLMQADIGIDDEAYAVYNNERLFGLLQVSLLDHGSLTDYAFMVGLRGSHDQSMSRGLAVGSRVFVCDNLAFSGEHVIRTKQTLNVSKRMPSLIHRAVDQLPGMFQVQQDLFDDFRRHTLSDHRADAMLTDMVRQNILPVTKLKPLLDEWDNPTFEEHDEDGQTLWSLHNAFTQVLKPPVPERANLMLLGARTQHMTSFLRQALREADEKVIVPLAA